MQLISTSRIVKAMMCSLFMALCTPALAGPSCPFFQLESEQQVFQAIRESRLTELLGLLSSLDETCQSRYSEAQQILHDIGWLYLSTHTFPDQPTSYYSEKLLAQDIDLLPEEQRVLAYAVLAEHFLIFGDYKAAVSVGYIVTTELADQISPQDGVYTFITISNIFARIGFTDIASDYAQRAARLANAPTLTMRTLIPLYASANESEKIQRAEQIRTLTATLPVSMNRAEGWYILGLNARVQGNPEQAKAYFSQAKSDAKQANALRLYVSLLLTQAEMALSNGDRETVQLTLNEITLFPVEQFEAADKLRFASLQADLAELNRQNEQALYYTQQELALTSAIQTSVNNAIIANALARYKVNENEKELALVKKQQQYQALENRQQQQLMWIYILGLISASLLLVLVSILLWKKREHAAHYKHLASRDPLTQALNRRAIEELGQAEFQQARPLTQVVIAFADIDHFKTINDQHGHDTGDMVLKQFAACAKSVMRKGDYLGRWGGEEWLMLFPDTELTAMPQFFERLQASLDQVQFKGQKLTVTFSMGAVSQSQYPNFEEAVIAADNLMYEAKKSGRNQLKSAH